MADDPLLNRVYMEMREFRAEMREKAKRTDELLEEHHTTLFGDGNGSPGLRMRTDRLEQKHANLVAEVDERKEKRKLHFWAIWSAILASIGTAIASWFAPRP